MPNVCPSHDDDDDDQQSGRAFRKLWEKKHCFCSAVWHAYAVVLGPSKVLRGIVEAQPLLRAKRDQEVRRVKYNVYRCFIVGRGAAAAAHVASPVKSVPGEKRVSTSQATVFYSIIVRKRRDWKHG